MRNANQEGNWIRGLAVAMLLFAVAASAFAQGPGAGGPPAAPPFTVNQVRPNIYYVAGGGGNAGVIVGTDGVIVIDAKTSAAGGMELLADIAKITPKPVTTVIITHSDGDHVNGLAGFPKGLTIIAQENCKVEMQASLGSGRGAAPADYMPTKTIAAEEKLTINGVHLDLRHWAPAHTGGDLIIYLPDDKVVFTGDIIVDQAPYSYPLLKAPKGGSSEGWITTMNGILTLDVSTYVPGHGDVETRADVQKRLADASARRDRIKEMVAEGWTLNRVKEAFGEPIETPATASPTGGRGPVFPLFTEIVYNEFSKK